MEKSAENKATLITLAAAALLVSFTYFVFAPFEMYLGNLSEFWFKISDFWFVPLIAALIVLCAIFAVGFILRGRAREVYTALVFGSGLAIYIQSNFLNLKLGRLNGSKIIWHDYKANFIFNMIIWLAIIFVPAILAVFLRHKVLKPIRLISALLVATQAVALCVLFGTANWQARPKADGYISTNGIMEAATQRNVIVLVLDMYNHAFFNDILQREPQLAQELDGFTAFDNYTGAYAVTVYAVPSMLSGGWMRNEASIDEMADANYAKAQYWRELKENKYKYNIYTQDAHLPQWMTENVDNFVSENRRFTSYTDFARYIYRFVASKYMPNGLKPYVWMHGTELDAITEGNGMQVFVNDNESFRSMVQPVDMTLSKAKNQFSYIHIWGSHMPYFTDNEGKLTTEETSVEAAAHGALRLALDYIHKLEAIDKYDDATVIITADHGHGDEWLRQAPLMLVKPAHAHGELQHSYAPVCQMDIIPTIMSDVGLNADHSYGKSMFEYKSGDERERLYYETDWVHVTNDPANISTLREYTITSAGNVEGNMYRTKRLIEKNGDITIEE